MPVLGWKQLLVGAPWFRKAGAYPIQAYSEFMPPVRLGPSPYGGSVPSPFNDEDPWGWQVSEFEEEIELRAGLSAVAHQLVGTFVHLGRGESAHGISKKKLADNPFWPPALADRAGSFGHERYVVLMPLALSRTQDDKGRVRWTLFGGSEQGPARAFWRSFQTAPGVAVPTEDALDFFRRLLSEAYGLPLDQLADLHRAGFRILTADDKTAGLDWPDEKPPRWAARFEWRSGQSLRAVSYLLTFRPFGRLPVAVQRAYLAGDLHLLPFPGSLIPWGIRGYFALRDALPLAMQIPILQFVHRHESAQGIRVPQSGWVSEPKPGGALPEGDFGPMRGQYWRSHRNASVLRDELNLAVLARDEKLAHVLFSSAANDVGLYGKPMARNAQIWTQDFRLLLDGPNAARAQIDPAILEFKEGGLFGYRLQFPAMRVGRHEVYWHRPLVAYISRDTGEPTVMPDAPLGYLTAYRADRIDVSHPIELWPRLLRRDVQLAAIHLFEQASDPRPHQTTMKVRKLLDARRRLDDRPLPRDFARSLLVLPKGEGLDDWLDSLPAHARDADRGQWLVSELRRGIETGNGQKLKRSRVPEALTFSHTAKRSFEVAYWNTIVTLSHGLFLTKNNADCVQDAATRAELAHHWRDLDPLGEHLITHYTRVIAAHKMTNKALVGDLPFHWRTDFDFPWSDGWLKSQEGPPRERDVVVVIPGRDRRRAVIMADHYDTAYMADHFEKEAGGTGARIAAAGADDNCSATATLMLAAQVFLKLSRQGRLGCDVWLVHLTGEEFPADCLGARHLARQLVEGTLALRLPDDRKRDLSKARVQGVFVLDMVAHNSDHEPDIFQIAPGTSCEAMWLAYQAHVANALWNASVETWNGRPSRRLLKRGRRRRSGTRVPDIARHLSLRAEVRPHYAPRSTLYNTDGQIFSDTGIPVVLFMENYDINRTGYHDSQDTMANIDLDYGAAVAAIAIETVARAATEKPMSL